MKKKTPPLSRVVYERSGAYWVASMPSIRGAYSQGRTQAEAYANLLDAVSELVKAHKELAAASLARRSA